MSRFFYPFVVPNGALAVAAIIFFSRSEMPAGVLPFLHVFPPLVLGIALFLGWRFNRTRLLYATALLVIFERALALSAPGEAGGFVLGLAAVLLPLNLAAVALFRERGVLNLRGAAVLAALLAQLGGGAWIHDNRLEEVMGWLEYRLVPLAALDRLPLPQPALASFALAAVLLAVRFWRRPEVLEGSFLWAILTILFALAGPGGGQPLALYLASAGLILVIGVVETSHFMAYRDELTGLPGRRALNEALARLGRRYAVALLDIDHFKKFNDTYGHDVGDQVLRMVASKLEKVGGGGKVYRYGGEEFAVVFARRSVEQVLPHLEALREMVADARFIPRGKDRPKTRPRKAAPKKVRAAALSVTISIGAAQRAGEHASAEQVFKAADQALYRAKKAGRNQVAA